ncbi:MAG: prolyl oligopeptidase family serine peptidase [Phycisphaerae bacterium]
MFHRRMPWLALVLLANVCTAHGQTHPFSVHDMLLMDRLSDPQVSPEGDWVVFVRRKTDMEANRGRTDLWMVHSETKKLRRLTSHESGDYNPRWSPDGKAVYFLSSRSGSSQVWRIPTDGGEATQVSDLPLDVTALQVSPDGKRLAIAMDVFPDAESLLATKQRLSEIENQTASGRIYDRIFVRHWDTWKNGTRSHLFVLGVDGIGEPLDVMRGMDADCPTKPFGGPEDFTFTPDSGSVVFCARDVGREEPWSTDFDLYAAPCDGDQPRRCLTEANEAWDANPVFSPDGKMLAYTAMERPGYESDRMRIMLMAWPDGEPAVLTQEWDRSARDIVFSADGSTIYTRATNLGQVSLFAVDRATQTVRTLIAEGTVSSVGVAGKRLVYGLDHLNAPTELFTVKPDGSNPVPLTRINEKKMAATRLGTFESFTFSGWNGDTVHAYAGTPIDFDKTKKYPVAFLIHGGPQGSFGNHFHYRWNPQVYSGAGYAVIMVDFHGSTGYGQAFCDSIRGDWGGKPLEDLKMGLAAALAKYPWMDSDRVVALGASFGGFMINWIEGNWPDRFLCLVNHDGNLDERMAYFDTEELWFPEWDHMGNPWDNPANYEKHNPINYVKNWRTPMLVIHGAHDYRVVDTQGLSTFTALQRRGIPSKLLYFPDESHWVLKPANSVLWHDTVIGWIDEWAKK